ncbi:MAG: D-alanyl-D-alanine carboxypeptidase/D-alanyl-D-alanine endopeptidase [Planctomycetota bacterium]|jgi:D-alanyl-D-alanine carboxypeptidase/D-alanyl-D-alanine-endopeptidase (penicillin-binding protein 4)
MLRRLWPVAALLLIVPGVLAQDASVPRKLRVLLAEKGPRAGTYGVHVVDAKTGETIFGTAAEALRMPASTMKIVTTAAALCELGHEYRFRTEVLAASRPRPDGVLPGDLVVVGGGDPTLEAESEGAAIDDLSRQVARSGVRRIAGDIVLDDGRFDRILRHPSWPNDQWKESYSAAVSALTAARGCVTVSVSPGKAPGKAARVSLSPSTGIVRVRNEITTTAKKKEHRIGFDLRPDGDTIRCWGKIWIKSTGFSDEVAVNRPTDLFGDVFHRALVRAGVSLTGEVVRRPGAAKGIADAVTLAARETGILDLLEATNKPSQNLFAECLLKTLGAERAGEGSFEAGAAAAARFAEEAGVAPAQLRQADGSGLSRENLVSPSSMTTVLRHVYGTPHRIRFMKTLPTGGDPAGTLRRRLADLGADIRAKTGTIRGVSALAGYLQTKSGRVLCFAVLVNDRKTPPHRAREIQDELCRILHRGY